MNKEKQQEEYEALIEIQNDLCDKPCDTCKMYGKGCIPSRMAKKLAEKGYRKQKKGKWIPAEEFDEKFARLYKCSSCGASCFVGKYCVQCGAEMKERTRK